MNQHWMMAPETRRQEVQWSKETIGRRSVISLPGPIGYLGGVGIRGRDDRVGTETV